MQNWEQARANYKEREKKKHIDHEKKTNIEQSETGTWAFCNIFGQLLVLSK